MSQDFWSTLREDMLQTRGRRSQLQLAKVASIGTVAAAATVLRGSAGAPHYAYVIPLLAIAFDFLILGESLTLRRMARFVLEYRGKNTNEEKWEHFVRLNPVRFSTVGNLVITLLCILGSVAFLVLTSVSKTEWISNQLNIVWVVAVFTLFSAATLVELFLYRRPWKFLPESRHSPGTLK